MNTYKPPSTWQERFAKVPELTMNRGQKLTLWLNTDECYLQDASCRLDHDHEKGNCEYKMEITIDLDGLLRIKWQENEWIDDSRRTKSIAYRG
jgi:hypothetical protein